MSRLNDRTVVIVLGVQRSGTSALAGALELFGVDFGPAVREFHPHNPKGHFENPAVGAFNNALAGPFPTATPLFRNLQPRDHAGIELILAAYAGDTIGLKDENFIFTLRPWLEHIGQARLVATFRHPDKVFRSAAARMGSEDRPQHTNEIVQERWIKYHQCLLELWQRSPFPIFCFDNLDQEYFSRLEAVVNDLGLKFDVDVARDFLDIALVRQRETASLPKSVQQIYDDLLAASRKQITWQPLLKDDLDNNWLPIAQRPITERERQLHLDIWHDQFLYHTEALVELQRLQRLVDVGFLERDTEILRLQEVVDEAIPLRDAEIQRLQGVLDDTAKAGDAEIQRLNAVLNDAVTTRDAEIQRLNAVLNDAVTTRDTNIQQLQETFNVIAAEAQSKDGQIAELDQTVRGLSENLLLVQSQLEQIHAQESVPQELSKELRDAKHALAAKQAELMKMSHWAHGIHLELQGIKARPHMKLAGQARNAGAFVRNAISNSFLGDLIRHVRDSKRYRKHMVFFEALRASLTKCNGRLLVTFPIITWDFRWQRPQHLVSGLRDQGFSVLYLAMSLAPLQRKFRSYHEAGAALQFNGLAPHVHQIWLHSRQPVNVYSDPLVGDDLANIVDGMVALLDELKPKTIIYLLQFPAWWPVAAALKEKFGGSVVFDCMDDHGGFSTNTADALKTESHLIKAADLVVTSSALLEERCAKDNLNTIQIKNGTEFEHFADPKSNGLLDHLGTSPVIGYYGAISDWFDMELVAYCARLRPNWNFVLIGATFGADLKSVEALPNVHFLGEKPYKELPGFLAYFDVCTIPFKIIPLTLATNPVKFYEYLSAGKPVVSVKLPELVPYAENCYLATTPDEFLAQLEVALSERDDKEKISQRVDLAKDNSWDSRVKLLMQSAVFGQKEID